MSVDSFRWATVTQRDPLRVRLDGDTAELPVTPDSMLLGPLDLGQRVWVQFSSNRIMVVGSPRSYPNLVQFQRLQTLFQGGGNRIVTSTGVGWTRRFIFMGSGRGGLIANGYYDCNMPSDGTVITRHGIDPEGSVTVASGIIPMSSWDALYYEPDIDAVGSGTFHLVYYTAAFDVPEHWILIVVRNGDISYGTMPFMWGDGQTQDYWHTPTLLNSWVNYGGGFAGAGYRQGADGRVHLRGLVKSGTISTSSTGNVFSFPSYLAPDGSGGEIGSIFIQMASGNGAIRVDVTNTGNVRATSVISGGTNGFLSLDGISWFPAGSGG